MAEKKGFTSNIVRGYETGKWTTFSNGKSSARHIISSIVEEAFFCGEVPTAAKAAETGPVTFGIDGTTAIKGSLGPARTGENLCRGLWALAVSGFRMFPLTTERSVLVFDRSALVSVAKGVEQLARDVTSGTGAEKQPFGNPEKDLNFGALPDAFELWTHDRGWGTPCIIRFVLTAWLHWAAAEAEDDTGFFEAPKMPLPEGKHVIVSGHYLRGRADLRHGARIYIPPDLKDEDFEDTPIVFRRKNGVIQAAFDPRLKNKIGEGDLSLPFLIDRVTPPEKSAVMLSIDTDFMYFGMLMRQQRIFWMHWPKLHYVYSRMNLPIRSEQRWVDLGTLRDLLPDRLGISHFRNPILFLTIAMNIAGGDYTEKFDRTPHHHFLRALLVHHGQFPDLVQFNDRGPKYTINASALNTFVRATYRAKSRERTPPPEDELAAVARHADLYLYFLSQFGESVVADPPDLREYGYTTIDPGAPMSRTNIERVRSIA
jgi:hypothetical protein